MNLDDLRRLSFKDVGNWPILWGIGGMFLGAYAQGYARSVLADRGDAGEVAGAD